MLGSLRLLQPTTVSEASAALDELGESAKLYAGGAELLLLMRHGLVRAESLIDVKNIARLHNLTWDGQALRIGSCVSHRTLETAPIIREHAPTFAFAESQVANVRVRNQGTLGGNLCFNDPHSDPGTVLLVHSASVSIGSQTGERQLSLEDFFVDMYATDLRPNELLMEVQIPPLPAGMKSAYLRLHRFQRPTLGVAVAVKLDNEIIEETRIAVGCVGPRAQRLQEIEAKIRGASLNGAEQIVKEQKNYFRDLLRPVDDLLGSSEYKLYMTCVLIARALESAIQGSGNGAR
jgi:carbon-monoxide dehydrogenase medium subunit